MNKYQIEFISGQAEPDSIELYSETEDGAIEWLRVDHQQIAPPFEILNVSQTHHETKAERFERYTANLKQIDADTSHQFFEFVVEYWSSNDWRSLYNLTTGAYCFCTDENIKQDISKIASLAESMLHR